MLRLITAHIGLALLIVPLLLAAATAPDMQNSPEAVNVTQEFESGIGAVLDCSHEIQTYCQDVTPGEGRIVACLQAYEDKVSAICRAALDQWKRPSLQRSISLIAKYPSWRIATSVSPILMTRASR